MDPIKIVFGQQIVIFFKRPAHHVLFPVAGNDFGMALLDASNY